MLHRPFWGTAFEPPACRSRFTAGSAHLIRIGAVMCLAARQETMYPRIAPLLRGSTRAMPCTPRSQTTIIRSLQILGRHSRRRRLLGQAVRIRKYTAKLGGVRTCAPLPVLVRFESDVCSRITPIHRSELLDLALPFRRLLPCQPRIILVRPTDEFTCPLRHLNKRAENRHPKQGCLIYARFFTALGLVC